MRRKDREITDFAAILQIIDRCDVVRLGLADGACPYIVPLNFAYTAQETADGPQLTLYVHGAMAGRKYELMQKNSLCAFEMDIPLGIECIADKQDVTMRYQSVMGTARIELLDGDEKQSAIDDVLMARYPETWNFPYRQSLTARTAVARLTVLELSAKANLKED